MTDRQPELILFLFLFIILFIFWLLCKYLMEKWEATYQRRKLERMKEHIRRHYEEHK